MKGQERNLKECMDGKKEEDWWGGRKWIRKRKLMKAGEVGKWGSGWNRRGWGCWTRPSQGGFRDVVSLGSSLLHLSLTTYVCSKCHKAKLLPTFQSSPARHSPLSSTNSPPPPPSQLRHSTSAFLRSLCSPSKILSSSSWSLQILAILWGPMQASCFLKHSQLTLRSPLSELWPRSLPS